MAEKAIHLGGEATADAIVSAVDTMYSEHTFNEKDFVLKHNDAEIAMDSNFAAQSFWKQSARGKLVHYTFYKDCFTVQSSYSQSTIWYDDLYRVIVRKHSVCLMVSYRIGYALCENECPESPATGGWPGLCWTEVLLPAGH